MAVDPADMDRARLLLRKIPTLVRTDAIPSTVFFILNNTVVTGSL